MMMMETSDQTEQSREQAEGMAGQMDNAVNSEPTKDKGELRRQRTKVNDDVDKANNKHKPKKNEECKGSAEEARIYYYHYYIYMAVSVSQNSVGIDQSRRYGYAYRVTAATTAANANANKHTKNS